jgi:phage gpG-like protein
MAFNFKQKVAEFKRLEHNLPKIIANSAKRHFLKSFKDEGFTDVTLSPWAKRTTRNSSDRNNPTKRRGLLIDSGHLRGSIDVRVARWDKIKISSKGIPYAKYHNRGKGNNPKRQFIGESYVLNEKIKRTIKRNMKKLLK